MIPSESPFWSASPSEPDQKGLPSTWMVNRPGRFVVQMWSSTPGPTASRTRKPPSVAGSFCLAHASEIT